MKRLRGVLGVFLIFFFGVVVGAALTGGAIWKELYDVIEGGPDAVVAKIADRMGKELQLGDTQKKMLDHIVTETRIELRTVRADSQPRVAEVVAGAERKIRAVLGPEQQKKFDQIVENSRRKWDEKPAGQ
jgi:hypothetical protein